MSKTIQEAWGGTSVRKVPGTLPTFAHQQALASSNPEDETLCVRSIVGGRPCPNKREPNEVLCEDHIRLLTDRARAAVQNRG